jgi:hypothetical protein
MDPKNFSEKLVKYGLRRSTHTDEPNGDSTATP